MGKQNEQTFQAWVMAVDKLVIAKVGLSVHDLPDQDFRTAYDDGTTPEEFYDDNIREELQDIGFSLEIADMFDDAQEKANWDLIVAATPEDEMSLDELLDSSTEERF